MLYILSIKERSKYIDKLCSTARKECQLAFAKMPVYVLFYNLHINCDDDDDSESQNAVGRSCNKRFRGVNNGGIGN